MKEIIIKKIVVKKIYFFLFNFNIIKYIIFINRFNINNIII